MSGHSKWNNIKRKKEKTDGQRAKIFTKIGREMSVCVKAGGGDPNVNTTGCVGFLFSQQGVIVLDVEGKDEETVMEDVFDAGAEDFDMGDGVAEVTTTPAAFSDVRAALEDKGYEFISADVAMVPSTYTALSDPDDLKKMGILLDHLEDDDDVQNVWHNLENEEDLDR